MSDVLKFIIEFLLTFIAVYLIYYFIVIRKSKRYNPNRVPVEVNLILLKYKIDIKKVNYKKMLIMISFISSFDIAIVVTVLSWYIRNIYIIILLSMVLLIPLSLIGFHLIGRHFEKETVKNTDNK